MKKIKLSPFMGSVANLKIKGAKILEALMSEEEITKFVSENKHKVQSNNHKFTNDYGVPKMRPCGFPKDANPMEKRGKRLGNIHKMYTFKSMVKAK